MKRYYKILILVVLAAAVFFSFRQRQIPEKKEAAILLGVERILEYAHYHPKEFNDVFSQEVWKEFLKDVDPSKRYFLQSDIDSLSVFKDQIDDEIKYLQLNFYEKTYHLAIQRQQEALQYIDSLLQGPFDFEKEEIYNTDFDNIPYAKTKEELIERWRKYLKFNTLSRLYDKIKEEEKKFEKDKTYQPKTRAELEKEALEGTRKSIKNFKEMINDVEESDYFSMYMNAITMQFDPHTNYFSPQGKERFDTSMSGSFEGIGARLQKEGDYVKIVEVIAGGPAWKDGKLKVGDLIQKVAQGDEEAIDIMGMRLSKVVKLIKGPKGTVVKLIVKRIDGSIETIPITRDRVELEETFAKSLIINHNNQKFGYIYLPKFYADFKQKNRRTAATDIKKELLKLNDQNVKGIVLDLRYNGGGSLATVIDIAGYFVPDGPVVQVKDKKGEAEVLDQEEKTIFKGNVVVLVNEMSASASEILAAALQDYNRAIIIGSQTYGKGTVQNLIGINQVQGNEFGDLGALKWTTKKFYRISGGSTQRKGVIPDITIPDPFMYLDIRENDEPTALPWDQIKKAKYKIYTIKNKKALVQGEQARINQSPLFQHIEEKARWMAENKKDHIIYLNWDKYVQDVKNSEAISKKFDSLTKFESNLTIKSLPIDIAKMIKDTVFENKRNKWIKDLKKDPYLDEAVRVLEKM